MAKFSPGTSNSKELFFLGGSNFHLVPRLQICPPKNIFGKNPPEMVPKMDLNIGDSRVLAALIQSPVYGLIVSLGAMPV